MHLEIVDELLENVGIAEALGVADVVVNRVSLTRGGWDRRGERGGGEW